MGRVDGILGLMSVVAWALAQAGQGVPGQAPGVLRVTTRLVVVDVVVHDKQGLPVSGLTRNDFTILDSGKKQKITVFSVESGHTAQRPERSLPPNFFSNRVAREGGVPTNVAVILLDGLDTKFEDQAYARRQVVKFLSQLQPQDRVALCVLGSQLRVIQDFTDDPTALLEALGQSRNRVPVAERSGPSPDWKMGPQIPSGPVATARARLDAGINDLMIRKQPVYAHSLWDEILPALQAIANHLAGLPGHKSLVWLTGSVPLPQTLGSNVNPLLRDRIRHTIQVLNQDDVALYPVDARGLFADPGFSAESRTPRGGSAVALLNEAIEGMNYYAQQTGGRAFCNTNDLSGAMRAALDDSEVTYTLGYYPSHGRWDGEYRPIQVKLDRKGVKVRYRRGYFASAGKPIEDAADPVALLKAAAQSPLDATGIGVTVRLSPLRNSTDRRFEATVYIDARGMTFRPATKDWAASFELWAGQYSSQGDSLGGISRTVSAKLKENNYQKVVRAGGFHLTFEDKVNPKAQELRVAVRDALSGSIGSVRIPLRNLLQLYAG